MWRSQNRVRIARVIFGLAALIALVLGSNLIGVRVARAGTLTVNSASDYPAACAAPGTLCLREAIAAANPGDVITFALPPNSGGFLLSLWRGTLNLTKDLTIRSTSASRIDTSIESNQTLVFNIANGAHIVLDNFAVLEIGGINAPNNNGGAIYNAGTLTIQNSTVSSSGAVHGGGLYNAGTAVIINTSFHNDQASYGGAIYNAGSLTFVASSTAFNQAYNEGAGIYNAAGATTLISNSALGQDTLNGSGGGGDIANYGTLTVANTTFRSTSYKSNPGLAIWTAPSGATTYLGSSIVTTYNLPQAGANELSGPLVSLGYNLVADGTGSSGLTNGVNHDQVGTANAPIDPQLGDNGGYSSVIEVYPPASTSPAVSAGFCGWATSGITPAPPPVTIDALGQVRKTPCDVGSVEATPLSITLTPSITPTASDTPTPTSTLTPPPTHEDSIGVYRQGTFYLRLHNTTGYADQVVTWQYADSDSYPLVLDWAGQGFDTIGVYNQSSEYFYLCLVNDTTNCNNFSYVIAFQFGAPLDMPLGGRWQANAQGAGVGLFRPSNGLIFLKNYLTSGYADYQMVLGIPGDIGMTGDWSGQGFDSPGVYRPSLATFYLSNQVTNGVISADYQVTFGLSGDLPIAGDWTVQGHDGIGVFRPTNGATYLKNALTTGYADNTFTYGIAGDIPVAGHWQLTYPPVRNPGSILIPPTRAPTPTAVSTPGGGLQD